MPVLKVADLPLSNIAHEFVGADHGGVGVCVIIVEAPPGRGPSLHTHPYEELLLVQEGSGTFTLGDETLEVGAGELVVVPPGVPHAFTNTGEGVLKQIDIHVSPSFSTEWLGSGESQVTSPKGEPDGGPGPPECVVLAARDRFGGSPPRCRRTTAQTRGPRAGSLGAWLPCMTRSVAETPSPPPLTSSTCACS